MLRRIFLAASVALLAIAWAGAQPSAEAILQRYDKNGDGGLSRDELPEKTRQRFERFDTDGNGLATAEELRRVVAHTRPSADADVRPGGIEPSFADVPYGPHERNVLDLWMAPGQGVHPIVVHFHGGGFRSGDKKVARRGMPETYTARGISFASANYRLTDTAPYPAAMHDAARAIQFLRHHAARFRIDPARIGASGGSAGAGISLWLAFHDDLADPRSEDPVLRQSSRIAGAAVSGAQSTYDPREIARLFDTKDMHPALPAFYGMASIDEVNDPKYFPLYKDASPISHLTKDDPPVLLFYKQPDKPLPPGNSPREHIHHPKFGRYLKEKADPLGVSVTIRLRDDWSTSQAFFDGFADFFSGVFAPPADRKQPAPARP